MKVRELMTDFKEQCKCKISSKQFGPDDFKTSMFVTNAYDAYNTHNIRDGEYPAHCAFPIGTLPLSLSTLD